jgi:MoxR-like ATPase
MAEIRVVPLNLVGTPSAVLLKPGFELPTAGLTPTLEASFVVPTTPAVPQLAALTLTPQVAQLPTAVNGTQTNSPASPDAALNLVQKAVQNLPDLGTLSGGDAHGAGQNLSDAVTGEKSVSGAGDAVNAQTTPGAEPSLQEQVTEAKGTLDKIRSEVGKVIIGQQEMVDGIIMAMVARQHVLLEGLPGVGKTETAKAFADAVEGAFQRVQGTPDKLPSDILGSEILQEDPATGRKDFQLSRGPVFTNILLVDEINRMPPKAQAALLEAMAEGRVTIGRQTLDLHRFTVIATQNPVEQDGTYRLPEAQVDRFMFKVLVKQPTADELRQIMQRNRSKDSRPKASKVTDLAELDKIRKVAESLPMDKDIEDYIVKVAMAASTHENLKKSVGYSVYTRAAILMAQAARINAVMAGRDYVSPADVRAVAAPILRHRIVLNYDAGSTTPDEIIAKILDLVAPPKPALVKK